MIDIHCHVLPGIDDGPGTAEAAIALARRAREDGITTIVATPHVDASYPANDSARIRAGVSALQDLLDTAGVEVRIVPGAEVAATSAMTLDDGELSALSIGGAGWLLVECPHSMTVVPGFITLIRRLSARGHRLVLAHPERCPLFLRSPELIGELADEGMLTQVTAGSLSGRYGRAVRRLATSLVTEGTAHAVASDGHGESRPALIAGELTRAGIPPPLLSWLAREVPAALLAGDSVPPRPPIGRPSRVRRLLSTHK
jgi:protein-tyrosine phosphatase